MVNNMIKKRSCAVIKSVKYERGNFNANSTKNIVRNVKIVNLKTDLYQSGVQLCSHYYKYTQNMAYRVF